MAPRTTPPTVTTPDKTPKYKKKKTTRRCTDHREPPGEKPEAKKKKRPRLGSGQREPPRDKPVAFQRTDHAVPGLSTNGTSVCLYLPSLSALVHASSPCSASASTPRCEHPPPACLPLWNSHPGMSEQSSGRSPAGQPRSAR